MIEGGWGAGRKWREWGGGGGGGGGGEWDLFLYENNIINRSHISGGWKRGTAVSAPRTRDLGPEGWA